MILKKSVIAFDFGFESCNKKNKFIIVFVRGILRRVMHYF